MSSIIIKDGSGRGYTAKVDSSNRLHTQTVSIDEQSWQSEEGHGYNISTGIINLTSASESAVLWFKYTGVTYFNVSALAVGIGKLGVSTDPVLIKVSRNPSTGTLIDNAVTSGIFNENRNFGATSSVPATIYKGAEGYTLNGDTVGIFYQTQSGRLFAPVNLILEPQTSIGITITPNDDGTGGNVYAALIGYEGTE